MDQGQHPEDHPPNADITDNAIPPDLAVRLQLASLPTAQLAKLLHLVDIADELDAALAFMSKVKVHCPVAEYIASQK